SVAVDKLRTGGYSNWGAAAANNLNFPVRGAAADIAIAGWSFGHSTVWDVDVWRSEINRAVSEMQRVLRSGGTAIILETLGTGSETPNPPSQALADYYAWLENELGFAHTWI